MNKENFQRDPSHQSGPYTPPTSAGQESQTTTGGGKDQMKETSAGMASSARESAREATEQLKESASAAGQEIKRLGSETLESIKQEGQSFAAAQRDQILSKVDHCSAAVRRAADQLRQENDANLAKYADSIAGQIERASNYFRGKDFRGLIMDAEQAVKRQPELFFGGLFVAGLVLARFLKASRHGMEEDNDYPRGTYYYAEETTARPSSGDYPREQPESPTPIGSSAQAGF